MDDVATSKARAQEFLDQPQDARVRAESSKVDTTEKHAASRLYFAKKLMREGKLDAAKLLLESLVREFPKSLSAEEAKSLLNSIP